MWQKIFLLCFCIVSLTQAADCARGNTTTLQLNRLNEPKFYRLDQSIGQSQFVLIKQDKPIFEKTYEGRWFCFAFNKTTNAYIVGGIAQTGAWLPLLSIEYLKEEGTAFIPSVFNREHYLANAAIISPKGRYIAFIGGKNRMGDLFVLDTQTDKIKQLGKAPLPPPVENFSSEEPFVWGTGWADGFVEIEKNVLSFKSETVLQVSYGKDTSQTRAKKRHIHIIDVTTLNMIPQLEDYL